MRTCPSCRGQKTVMGAGMMRESCETCVATGWLTDEQFDKFKSNAVIIEEDIGGMNADISLPEAKEPVQSTIPVIPVDILPKRGRPPKDGISQTNTSMDQASESATSRT